MSTESIDGLDFNGLTSYCNDEEGDPNPGVMIDTDRWRGKALSPDQTRAFAAQLMDRAYYLDGHAPSDYACAECGTKDAKTYVVTITDHSDVDATRTEVCLDCYTKLVHWSLREGGTKSLEDQVYEKCVHCHLFIDDNDAYVEGQGIARYIHLSRADTADERFEDHDAWPSGFKATLRTWRVFGPAMMRERFHNIEAAQDAEEGATRG